ncbi:MAG: hypothetical protein QNI88_12560, partial [Desulfobacterales bacterium]|nr:hypothetical protein [Desulfobacterales bacterium]
MHFFIAARRWISECACPSATRESATDRGHLIDPLKAYWPSCRSHSGRESSCRYDSGLEKPTTSEYETVFKQILRIGSGAGMNLPGYKFKRNLSVDTDAL